MVSIKEVAEEAGVSTATVSRVLSNKPHVRPEIRHQVLAAVEKLNYRPNLVARNLRAQQTNTIGLVVSDIRNPFFTDISRAVEDMAYAAGYRLILCNTDENPQKEQLYLNLMQDENVAGVIFSPTRQSAANFAEMSITFPTVVVDRQVADEVDQVLIDNVAAAYKATIHLLENGYRRIGAVFGQSSSTGRERCQGFEMALSEYGLIPNQIQYTEPHIESGYQAVLAMLNQPAPPDAILASNSLLTAGALKAIQSRQLTIPGQVALVGFDETEWANLVTPAVTVIAQPTYEIGKTAFELLHQRIAEPERPTRSIILRAELIPRPSSGSKASQLA